MTAYLQTSRVMIVKPPWAVSELHCNSYLHCCMYVLIQAVIAVEAHITPTHLNIASLASLLHHIKTFIKQGFAERC